MRPQKVEDKQVLDGIIKVFRSKGYEGASLAELADTIGLKKASLYHRFPGGKQEMAEVVLAYAGEWVKEYIISVLNDRTEDPTKRLKISLKNISVFYDNGETGCLFRALSMDNSIHLFVERLQVGMNRWIDAFTNLGLDMDFTEEQARSMATDVLISIQGSLIVSKTMDSTQPFQDTIKKIESMYVKEG